MGNTTAQEGWTDLGDNCSICYQPKYLKGLAEEAFKKLQAEVEWKQHDVRVMGRTVAQPRLVAYFATDTSRTYTYSGLKLQPLPFTPLLLELKEAAEKEAGEVFDSVLLNMYRDGSDHVGWHADNEKLYGPAPTIASLSFGTARDLMLRKNDDHERKLAFTLGSGDLLVMKGATQQAWQHCVPKRAPASKYGLRISATFRRVLFPDAAAEMHVESEAAVEAAAAAHITVRAPMIATKLPPPTGGQAAEAGADEARANPNRTAPMFMPKHIASAVAGDGRRRDGAGASNGSSRAAAGGAGRGRDTGSARGRRSPGPGSAPKRPASGRREVHRGPVENPLLVPAVTEAAVSAAQAAISRPKAAPATPESAADAAQAALKDLITPAV